MEKNCEEMVKDGEMVGPGMLSTWQQPAKDIRASKFGTRFLVNIGGQGSIFTHDQEGAKAHFSRFGTVICIPTKKKAKSPAIIGLYMFLYLYSNIPESNIHSYPLTNQDEAIACHRPPRGPQGDPSRTQGTHPGRLPAPPGPKGSLRRRRPR
jgi:hypothetical protein